jgi:hypothetical protein
LPDSVRGLTLHPAWEKREGPIFLVEGASDSLAMAAMGLCSIGRPSNSGGIDLLEASLKNHADRPVIVVGELDAKSSGDWPGRDGAIKIAQQLAARLGRDVSWAISPAGSKDVRAWVTAKNLCRADDWADAGKELCRLLKASAKVARKTELTGFQWEPIDSAAFAATDYRQRWLVERVFVALQPGIMGGPQKSLKTGTALDLGISLASATKFLGRFNVCQRMRVAILSGESGGFVLKETANRICQAKGIELADLADYLHWQFALPQLSNADHLEALKQGLRDAGIEVMLFDPLYLALLAGQGPNGVRAEDLFGMGPLLLAVCKACLDVGCTPILLHHTRKRAGAEHQPLELTDLAMAGVAEFARQWILISRKEQYEPGTGTHKLWMSVGGSAGQSGLWAVSIDEGVIDEHFDGRKWEVTVVTAGEEREAQQDAKQEHRSEKQREQDKADDLKVTTVLDKHDKKRDGISMERVKDLSGLSRGRLARAIDRLCDDGLTEELTVQVKVGNGAPRGAKGLRRKPISDGDEHHAPNDEHHAPEDVGG